MKKLNHPHGRQLIPAGRFQPGQSGNPAGKPKGLKNRATKELIDKLTASGMTPVEFMTAVFRDEGQPMELRLEAASRVAPYFHAKMSIHMMVPATVREADELLAASAMPGPLLEHENWK